MRINLKKLISDRPIAVRFSSRDDAQLFLDEMKEYYPEYVRRWSYATYSSSYERDGGVCYCPHFETNNGMMLHASKQYYMRVLGYEVVDFEDLLQEEVNIEEVDLPISLLLS